MDERCAVDGIAHGVAGELGHIPWRCNTARVVILGAWKPVVWNGAERWYEQQRNCSGDPLVMENARSSESGETRHDRLPGNLFSRCGDSDGGAMDIAFPRDSRCRY